MSDFEERVSQNKIFICFKHLHLTHLLSGSNYCFTQVQIPNIIQVEVKSNA